VRAFILVRCTRLSGLQLSSDVFCGRHVEANCTLIAIDYPDATTGEGIDQTVEKLRRTRVMGLYCGVEGRVDDLALLLRVPPPGPSSQSIVAVALLGNEPQMYIQLVVEFRQTR
jgi:hypothetical protein